MGDIEVRIMPASPMRDGRWLAFFCLARAAFGFIYTTYSAALPLLRMQWKMSAARAGMIQSAWHVGYLLSLFIVGFLMDRFGAKRTYLWGAVAAAASALVFASFASGFVSAMALYGLAGLCSGGTYLPGLALIGERFTPSVRGRAMGFYLAAASLGYGLSLVVSSRLLPVGGWQLSFLVTCSLPAAGFLLSLLVLRKTPNIVHREKGRRSMRHAIPVVLKNRAALLSMLAYTFHSWELLGMWAWLPAYLAAAAVRTAGGAGAMNSAIALGILLSGLTYFTSTLGSLIGGALSDRWGRSLTMFLFSCISLGFSFTLGWMLGWPLAILFFAAACYNLSAIADSSIYSTSITELVEPGYIGAAYAVRSVMGFGAGAVSPWVFGFMLDAGKRLSLSSAAGAWGPAWMVLGLGALPGPLMVLALRRRPEALRMAEGLR